MDTDPLTQKIVAAQYCTKAARKPSSWKCFPSVENHIHFLCGAVEGFSDPGVLFSAATPGSPCISMRTPHPKSAASPRFQASHRPQSAPNSNIVAPSHAVHPPPVSSTATFGFTNGRNTMKPLITQTILPTVNSYNYI